MHNPVDNPVDKLKTMATALASSIPPRLGQPTLPPIAWAQAGEIITVILADGRKVSANIQEVNALMFAQNAAAKPVDDEMVGANSWYRASGSTHPDLDALEAIDLKPTKTTTPHRRGAKK
jgi:hypothetical protein